MFASSAVTLCAALITSRRFDRSSSSAYILGHHTNQTGSQVCHCAPETLLPRLLEEGVFESRLKRARLGLADPESGTDFELRGAISFDVVPAALLERRAHCV